MRTPPAPVVWSGLFAAGAAYETYALRSEQDGDTLSECLRALFRVQRRAGKVMFTAVYVGFSAWFVPHIIAKAVEKVADAAAE